MKKETKEKKPAIKKSKKEKTQSFDKGDKIKAFLKKTWDKLLELIYPSGITCDCCKSELIAKTRYNLCAKCIENLPLIKGKKCLVCGCPINNEADYCLKCEGKIPSYEINRAPFSYEGIVKDMLLKLKFGGKRYFVNTLAPFMADCFLENGMSADIVAFVPMTAKEKRKRGFNQAELLAGEVAKRLSLPVTNALTKMKETKGQKNLTAKERAENLKRAFSALNDIFTNKTVLLIDDVFTTGATAEECALALKKAKAKKVFVLTAAVTESKLYMV